MKHETLEIEYDCSLRKIGDVPVKSRALLKIGCFRTGEKVLGWEDLP